MAGGRGTGTRFKAAIYVYKQEKDSVFVQVCFYFHAQPVEKPAQPERRLQGAASLRAWDAAGTQPRRPARRAGPVLEGKSLGCAPQEDRKGPRRGAQV